MLVSVRATHLFGRHIDSHVADRDPVSCLRFRSLADIAAVSIEQARKRFGELKWPKFTSYFTAADCYSVTLDKALPPAILPPQSAGFDAVTMQFCMHYAFETEEKARTMLTNVSSWLRSGGVFIGTIPNSTWLL